MKAGALRAFGKNNKKSAFSALISVPKKKRRKLAIIIFESVWRDSK